MSFCAFSGDFVKKGKGYSKLDGRRTKNIGKVWKE